MNLRDKLYKLVGGVPLEDVMKLEDECYKYYKIRKLQKEFAEKSELQRGFLHITFAGSNWDWGYIHYRYSATGSRDGEIKFTSLQDLEEKISNLIMRRRV